MNWVQHNIETPDQGCRSSSNLNSQDNGSIPHVGAQIQCLCYSDVHVEAKGAEVQEGDQAAFKAELPASSELVWRHCGSCNHAPVSALV